MSALGQKRTLDRRLLMSALHPKADIAQRDCHVRFVPKADIGTPRRSGVHQIDRTKKSANSGRQSAKPLQ
jgi:hypothetical protein